MKKGQWAKDEHRRFVKAVRMYGKDYKKITEYVGNRSKASVIGFALRFKNRKDLKLSEADIVTTLA